MQHKSVIRILYKQKKIDLGDVNLKKLKTLVKRYTKDLSEYLPVERDQGTTRGSHGDNPEKVETISKINLFSF